MDLFTFRLRIQAVTAAKVLTELYGKDAGLVGAQPEPITNSVLIMATPERIATIRKLIEQLDAESANVPPRK